MTLQQQKALVLCISIIAACAVPFWAVCVIVWNRIQRLECSLDILGTTVQNLNKKMVKKDREV